MATIKRHLLAHYVDADATQVSPIYVRIGDLVEELNIEMNANVETVKDITGHTSTSVDGYEPQLSIEPYYAKAGDVLYNRLQKIFDERQTLDDLLTHTLEVHTWEEVTSGVFVAYREDAIIEIVSYGGDTKGVQIPFNLHLVGNRVKGTFTAATKTFTPDSGTLGKLVIEVIKGGTTTTTKVSDVVGEPAGSTLYYKLGTNLTAPNYGDASTGYTALTTGSAITTAAGQSIVVVAVNTTIVAASDIVPVVVGA
ncbi:hypothetical protein [Anaerocolumna chitinilytica]|uniref:S-layer protein SbsC C-terminal domain-containing protein n=1 Tax=Anaerocolumna chitinilytica TaxID=1727145 RepID=A0A7M3SAI1_9FIRM|nr:hypothetical protein [Anaerocolumna chitinilytica]BCK01599.1 hypothetical protein bsdcttw_46390 [Anaerocolumna chitinilytica]